MNKLSAVYPTHATHLVAQIALKGVDVIVSNLAGSVVVYNANRVIAFKAAASGKQYRVGTILQSLENLYDN